MIDGYGTPTPSDRATGRWRHLVANRAWTVAAVAVAVALLVLTVVSLRGFAPPEPKQDSAVDSSTAEGPEADGGAQDQSKGPSLPDPASGSESSGPATPDDDSSSGDDGGNDGGGYPTGDYPTGGGDTGAEPTGSVEEAGTESECLAAGGVWCCACHSIPRYYYCSRGGCAG